MSIADTFGTPNNAGRQPKNKKIVNEIRCTCNGCGKVWHYLPHEKIREMGKAMSNSGKNMIQASPCTSCCGGLMPREKVRDFDQCPNCGSRNCKKEVIEHEKPSN
jgi:predicted RNA-binding Zn-ribbon protein involved in translation (DUF1610 family)